MTDQSEPTSKAARNWQRYWPWINLGIAILLILAGIWLIQATIGWSNVWEAVRLADGRFIFLALCVMVITVCAKAWRWGLLLTPTAEKVPYPALFWSTMLGQYVNMILPLFRLGEIARAYAINYQTGISKVRALSTMVVEKTLDLIMLALTLAIILPLVVLPDIFSENWYLVGLLGTAVLFGLYLLAAQTEFVTRVFIGMTRWLPERLRGKVVPLIQSGLEGVAALRSKRTSFLLIATSAGITFLAVLTPYILFHAFALPLGLAEAALVDSALSVTAAPPSTPGQIGIFEGTVTFVLAQLTELSSAILVSFAIVYHLVVLIPKIIFGSIASLRTNWKWQRNGDA